MVGGVRCIRPPLFLGRHTPRRPYCYGQPERESAFRASCAAWALSPRLRQGQGVGRRGGPGLPRLDALGRSLEEAGLEVPVITDGLAPEDALGTWITLFTPEAAAGGVLGLLRDGDTLRIDLAEGRIRTKAREFESREPTEFPNSTGTGYAARYARTALPALEGAGFD